LTGAAVCTSGTRIPVNSGQEIPVNSFVTPARSEWIPVLYLHLQIADSLHELKRVSWMVAVDRLLPSRRTDATPGFNESVDLITEAHSNHEHEAG